MLKCERCGQYSDPADLPPNMRRAGFCLRCIDEIWAGDPLAETDLKQGGGADT